MHILTDTWQDGFLDYAYQSNSYRIRVLAWMTLSPIESMYFVRSRDWRMVWNYLREDGPLQVARKVSSRKSESARNRKFVSGGVGEIIAAEDKSLIGLQAVFVAPSHPKCVERIVLPTQLCSLRTGTPLTFAADAVSFAESSLESEDIQRVKGFSSFSGDPAPDCTALLQQIEGLFESQRSFKLLPVSADAQVREVVTPQAAPSANRRLKGVLFGYGHYAKTNIVPNVVDKIEIVRVHEVDPTQLGTASGLPFVSDSSPMPRADENFDVYFLAGYHHTHAPVAAAALRKGAWTVIEKPIATTATQLDELVAAAKSTEHSRVLVGFQRRYSELTQLALKDLHAGAGEPVNFFSIVHEVPLPQHHWYRWPSSCSRVLSNGCHWIDLFLFCNRYSKPRDITSWRSRTGEMTISIELENDAVFSLALNETGSSRIGIEEYIEMRRGDVTARLINNAQLMTENSRKVLRRFRTPRLVSFARMYREFARRIAANQPGDSIESLEISGRAVLQVEELIRRIPSASHRATV